MIKQLSSLFLISALLSNTPTYWTFGLENGYDSNVLRFSELEKGEADLYPEIMGGMNTFDSHVLKGSLYGKKDIFLKGNALTITGLIGLTNYSQVALKQYESYHLKVAYKLGSYKKIEYSINHLDQYYLRHYINRDISSTFLAACAFSDRDQKVGFSHPLFKRTWVNVWGGYLQRYYNAPFTEFDLDIYYGRIKLNHSIRRFGKVGFQFEQGRAHNSTFQNTARASDFDRSYSYAQFYLPLSKTKQNKWTDGIGGAIRADIRLYDAENLGDPLHAGRNHVDMKIDYWLKKSITETISIKSTVRHRWRKTDSQFEWVESLKSFNQWQVWCKIEWNMIYDQY
ncbi:MAG: hypothetical protein ISR83_02740 [Candidatus Marinimicrobia bacterium]|nr:hypothetical protein [Candidatus Neomarinimicrobiota bacterium]